MAYSLSVFKRNAKKFLLVAGISTAAVMAHRAFALPPDYLPSHMHNEIDRSRYVDTDWSIKSPGTMMHIRTKASNGWRFDPLHGKALIEFRDANNVTLKKVEQPVWCQASLGGHGAECWFEADIFVADVWGRTAQIVYGSTYDTHPQGGEMPMRVPLYQGTF